MQQMQGRFRCCRALLGVFVLVAILFLNDVNAVLSCAPGQYFADCHSDCVDCPAGHYCSGGTEQPTRCPEGTENHDTGSSASGACTACSSEAGSVAFATSTGTEECTLCPAGFYCPDPTSRPLSCAWGTYSFEGNSSCSTCPAGYACPDRASTRMCDSGYYSVSGDALCRPCESGKYCDNPANPPQLCPSGSYSLGKATACTDCEAGYACPLNGNVPPVRCPRGFYAGAGNTSCTICPAGKYCADAAVYPPLTCPDGTFSLGGFEACIICPGGFECSNKAIAPVECSTGEYSVSGSTVCTSCPSGYECPFASGENRRECDPGTYSVGGSGHCTVCPEGKYCASTDASTALDCPAGSYSVGAQSVCTDCPAGFKCPDAKGEQIEKCAPGTYSAGGETLCHSCDAGYACTSTATADGNRTACSAGYYSTGGQVVCTRCRAGYACPDTTLATENACSPGTYSIGAQTSCTSCPAGYYCPRQDEAEIIPCPSGMYNDQIDQVECLMCPAGKSCQHRNETPVACASGYYSLEGEIFCHACPPGHYCSDPASTPVVCPAGTYSIFANTSCSQCSAGYYCPSGSMVSTPEPFGYQCPRGYYCSAGSGTPTPCPVATYRDVPGAVESADCLPCPLGYFCGLATGVLDPDNVCPRGAYCVESSSSPVDCPAGTYSDQLQNDHVDDCKACPAGYYCPQGSTTAGVICPAGYYCEASSSTPTACPEGTYGGTGIRGLESLGDCMECPPGKYCVSGTETPSNCPAGRYRASPGGINLASCSLCVAGYACPSAGMTTGTSTPCAAGHYCDAGTVNPTDNDCPAGTYTDRVDLETNEDCEICLEGMACAAGSTSSTMLDCSPGHYCPGASWPGDGLPMYYGGHHSSPTRTTYPTQYNCPAGTYSDQSRLKASTECYDCPEGYYCTAGRTTPNGLCQAGYYCPAKSTSITQVPCPAGTYSGTTGLWRSDQCIDCPPGSYCVSGSTAPQACPAGRYTNVNNTISSGACSSCPAGYYCELGSIDPVPCGVGKYSGDSASVCQDCVVGRYCPDEDTSSTDMSTLYICDAGLWCPTGTDHIPERYDDSCETGKYCEAGTTSPKSCPAGTYNPNPAQEAESDCLTCPAGYYCVGGQSTITGSCAPGYYCLAGSSTDTNVPCPSRRYRDLNGGRSVDDCALCPRGKYCEEAQVNPKECPRGYYCIDGVHVPEPCPLGTYGNSTGLRSADECTPCTPGYYCDGLGLSEPRGQCDPGYYCLDGSYTSAPLTSTIGGLCPRGGYCPVGSSYPSPCQSGTYNNFTGGQSQLDCSFCDAGYYCAGSNNPYPTAPCLAGYYCLTGSNTPIQYEVGPGYYSLSGAFKPEACPSGTYNPLSLQSTCFECDRGYYCPNNSMTTPIRCPEGSYCPTGSDWPTACPPGTFRVDDNGQNVTDCTPCTPGQYCSSYGSKTSVGDGQCADGYYCPGGQSTATPAEYPCPIGHYCEVGTINPEECPAGTFRDVVGAQSTGNCFPCTSGYYCNETGMSTVTGACSPGFYCTGGSTTATPSDGIHGDECPAGSYCVSGSPFYEPCPDGTFMPTTQADECLTCPVGKYCPSGSSSPQPCPQGYYCPEGTGLADEIAYTQFPCPTGSYSPNTELHNSSQCLRCPAGRFCGTEGLTAIPATECDAGYFCVSGAMSATGAIGILGGSSSLCPTGHYCLQGTPSPTACPIGTYNPSEGMTALGDCLPCTAGKYCASTGMSTTSGNCSAGYYCPYGQNTSQPENYVCPKGHRCPAGSGTPFICDAGYYQDETKQSSCTICPAGYYCPSGSTNFTDFDCPAGYYCPEGSSSGTDHACPIGTYSPSENLLSESECLNCTAGSYCPFTHQTSVSHTCQGGYYCISGATVGTPTDGVTGGRCLAGYYCPSGASSMTPCDPGKYCPSDGLNNHAGDCEAGWYCIGTSSSSKPTDGTTGNQCPSGYYCVAGSSTTTPCPPGTYGPSAGNMNITECLECTPGHYCYDWGLSAPSGSCAPGFYCPEGSVSNSTEICPIGHRCPEGSSEPLECNSGEYQNSTGQARCITCPAGYYCAADELCNGVGPSEPQPCPAGYYCPLGTEGPHNYSCPAGTFSNATHLLREDQCQDCPPGEYCPNEAMTESAGFCAPGYYCTGGSSSVAPLNSANGNICPTGHYCPEGSETFYPCPIGTWNNQTGQTSRESGCWLCDAGHYCNSSAFTQSRFDKCSPGFVCYGGATTPKPFDNVTGQICSPGTYCPEGSFRMLQCPTGSYNNEYGREECYTCEPGRVCETTGLKESQDCPAGYYCPSASTSISPCPVTTFANVTNLQNSSQCLSCTIGHYCDSEGLTAPTGLCNAGYFCNALSSTATPSGTYPASGICPMGSYCTQGTTSPTHCPKGTFGNVTGLVAESECIDCTPGYYCANAGMTSPTGKCDAGYYCPSGQTTKTPAAYVCPGGSYCVEGSPGPIGCAPGHYQPSVQMSTCLTCPAGGYCAGNTVYPAGCPIGSYCPEGSSEPIFCPNGTYSLATNLTEASQCDACVAGSYCTNGEISGVCAAGYICYSGQPEARPETTDYRGGPCPAGHYCVAGCTSPVSCTNSTVRVTTHGSKPSDCIPCPAGYQCIAGDPTATPCERGHYCPINKDMQECQMGTFNSELAAPDSSFCLPCKNGYYCPETAMTTYTAYPCPPGYYCFNASSSPVACPAGTTRNESLGASRSDCAECPSGYYCGEANISPLLCPGGYYCQPGSTEPLACPNATYCPPGTGDPITCPAGKYCVNATADPIDCPSGHHCPEGTASPQICEAGYYCPVGSDSANPCPGSNYCPAGAELPTPCSAGYYCPELSGSPRLCPAGMRNLQGAYNLSTIETACEICPRGTHGAAADRLSCPTCPAGYVCYAGTKTSNPTDDNRDGGHRCPPGTYCPAGSYSEIPCPIGKYQPYDGMTALTDCLSCPAGSYNDKLNQSACYPCGASSYSDAGASTCNCKGGNRAFLPDDGTCRCKPFYQFYDAELKLTEEDSTIDCVSIVYENCADTNKIRYSLNGECKDRDTACDNACFSGGVLNSETGMCDCSQTPEADDICDEVCRASQPTIHVQANISQFVVTFPNGTTSLFSFDRMPGRINCITENCEFAMIQSTTYGSKGMLVREGSYIDRVLGKPINSLAYPMAFKSISGRGNGTTLAEMVEKDFGITVRDTIIDSDGLYQPIVCLNVGGGIIWDVSAARSHYPVYMKDALLNTNPNFDYAAFIELKTRMDSGAGVVSSFSFTFTESGVYVFADNAERDRVTVVSVRPIGESCPSSQVMATTPSNLASVGAKQTDDIVLEPDWLLIGVILVCIALLIMGLVAFLYYFRKKQWGKGNVGRTEYRLLGVADEYNAALFGFAPFGFTQKKKKEESSKEQQEKAVDADDVESGRDIWDYEKEIELEDFNVKTFYDKLEDQTIHVVSQLSQQNAHNAELYAKIFAQTKAIKDLLADKLDRALGRKRREMMGDQIDPDKAKSALQKEIRKREEINDTEDDRIKKFNRLIRDIQKDKDDLSGADPSVPDRLLENMDKLGKVVRRIRADLEQERSRRDREGEDLRDICGDAVVDVATMSDETQQQDEDEMIQAQKKFISQLGKISERIASDRKQYETDSRDPKIAGDDAKLQELLNRQKEKMTQHQRELASLLATNTRSLHDTARSVINGHKLQADKHGKATQTLEKWIKRTEEERQKQREREARKEYELPTGFSSVLREFIAKTLHQMGLLTQSQLEDLLRANAKDRTLAQLADLDEETLKEMIASGEITLPKGLMMAAEGGSFHGGASGTPRTGESDDLRRSMSRLKLLKADIDEENDDDDSNIELDMQKILENYDKDFQRQMKGASEERERQLKELEMKLARRERMKKRKKIGDMADLEAEMEIEEMEAFEDLENRHADERKRVIEQMDTRTEKEIDHAANEAEKNRIRALHEREKRELLDQLDTEQEKQRQMLKARLDERQRRKELALQKKHEEEDMLEKESGDKEREALQQLMMEFDADQANSDEQVDAEWRRQRALLEERMKKRRARRKITHESEMKALQAQVEDDLKFEETTIEQRYEVLEDVQKSHLEEEKNMKLKQAMTEDEKDRIMEEYAAASEELEQKIAMDKQHQIELVRKKIEMRRKKKEAEIGKKHAEQAGKELESDQKELESIAKKYDDGSAAKSVVSKWQSLKSTIDQERRKTQSKANETIAEERVKMEEELKREEEKQKRELEEKIEQERRKALEAKRQELERELKKKLSDEQRKRIMEDYERSVKSFDDELQNERSKQQEEIKKKILEKKKQRQRDLTRAQQEALREQLKKQEEKLEHVHLVGEEEKEGKPREEGVKKPQLMIPTVREAVSEEETRKLEEEHAKRIEELRKKHEEMRKMEELRMKEEEEKERLRAEREVEERTRKELEIKKREMEKKKREAQTAEDADNLLKEHEKNMDDLLQQVTDQKKKQQEELEKRLEERRKKREAALSRKMHEEEERLEREKKANEEVLRAKMTHAAEKKALADAIAANVIPAERAEEAIEVVLQQRHSRELQEISTRQQKERSERIRRAEEEVVDQIDEERSELEAKRRQAVEQARGSKTRIRKIDIEHKKAMTELDKKQSEELERVREDLAAEIDVGHAQERLSLRQRQLDEIAEACEELSPQQTLLKLQGLEASKRSRELEEFRRQLESERNEQVELMEKEKKRLEEEQKKRMEAEMAQFEAELQAERERSEKEIEEQRKKREQMMEDLRLKKQKEKELELAKSSDLEEEQRKQIMQQHELEISNLLNAMSTERQMQEEMIRIMIEEKQRRKYAKKKKAIAEARAREEAIRREQSEKKAQMQMKGDDEWKQKLVKSQSSVQAAIAKLRKGAGLLRVPGATAERHGVEEEEEEEDIMPISRPIRMSLASQVKLPPGERYFVLPKEEEYFNILRKSPMYERIVELGEAVSKLKEETAKTQAMHAKLENEHRRIAMEGHQRVNGLHQSVARMFSQQTGDGVTDACDAQSYQDPTDAAFECEGQLEVVPLEDLSSVHSIIYKCALYVKELVVSSAANKQQFNLLIANKLPQTDYKGNAFRNSYYYDDDSSTLFIRQQRLDTLGDLILLVVHATAHAQCRMFETDDNTQFTLEFYRGLKACFESVWSEWMNTAPAQQTRYVSSTSASTSIVGFLNGLPPEGREKFVKEIGERLENRLKDLSM